MAVGAIGPRDGWGPWTWMLSGSLAKQCATSGGSGTVSAIFSIAMANSIASVKWLEFGTGAPKHMP